MANERVIVIGAGGISNAWFPIIIQEELRVVGVVDVRPGAAQAQLDKYEIKGGRAFTDLDEALRTCPADFAIDLTVPEAHCEVTCKALRAGLHVIGEKPMAGTIEQARQMVAASVQSGKMFMVSQSRRWDASHATLANAVRKQQIGKLTMLNCDFFMACHFGGFRDEMASPLVLDMAIHHFDQARMFSGLNAVAVYCSEWNPAGSWYMGDVSAVCIFEMEGGVRFVYRGSWCAEGCQTSWNGDWRVIGTDGTLIYEGDKPVRGQVVASRNQPAFYMPLHDLEIEQVPMEAGAMHGGLREMLAYLREGKTPQTACTDNIQSLAMVLAAIKSSREKRRVELAELLAG